MSILSSCKECKKDCTSIRCFITAVLLLIFGLIGFSCPKTIISFYSFDSDLIQFDAIYAIFRFYFIALLFMASLFFILPCFLKDCECDRKVFSLFVGILGVLSCLYHMAILPQFRAIRVVNNYYWINVVVHFLVSLLWITGYFCKCKQCDEKPKCSDSEKKNE